MELTDFFQPGMAREDQYQVEEAHTAIHVGSGSYRVLATPWLIGFMERTARRLLAEHLPEGYSSVGVLVNVRHLAPSAVGSRLRVLAEVVAIDGWGVTFNVQAWDDQEHIGSGQHQRVVIEEARFLRRLAKKTSSSHPD